MFVDDPFDDFKPNSRAEVTNIYENVFKEIIKIYSFKNNYSALPTFLNYKIIKSNVYLEKFYVIKTNNLFAKSQTKTKLNHLNDFAFARLTEKFLNDCDLKEIV